MQNTPAIDAPKLSHCDNRSKMAQHHPTNGSPADWFSADILADQGKSVCTFHFFVDHKLGILGGELWLKQVAIASNILRFQADRNFLEESIEVMPAYQNLRTLRNIGAKLGLAARLSVLPEPCDDLNSLQVLFVSFKHGERVDAVELCDYAKLTQRIKKFSGGPQSMGKKRLILGETDLECKLANEAKSGALWPTDADCVILDQNGNPVLLLEFKKDTKNSSLAKSGLGVYYTKGKDSWNADNRKYNNLAVLRDGLGSIPFVVLYYSSKSEVAEVKLELLDGRAFDLSVSNSKMIAAPSSDISTHRRLVEEVLLLASV